MAFDVPEYGVGWLAREFDKTLAALGAETGDDFVRIGLEAGDDLPAIASRGAPSRVRRVKHYDALAAFRGSQGGREAGDAGADNRKLRVGVSVQAMVVPAGRGDLPRRRHLYRKVHAARSRKPGSTSPCRVLTHYSRGSFSISGPTVLDSHNRGKPLKFRFQEGHME